MRQGEEVMSMYRVTATADVESDMSAEDVRDEVEAELRTMAESAPVQVVVVSVTIAEIPTDLPGERTEATNGAA